MTPEMSQAVARAFDDYDRFMEAMRLFAASRVARALTKCTPGINWQDCTKGHMGRAFAMRRTSRYSTHRIPDDVIERMLKIIQEQA